MAAKNDTDTSDREIVATRTFDAPPTVVFDLWTDPKHIAEWWGPIGFTNTIHEMDVRPGGKWRLVMHGPDGTDYPNENRFVEIDRPNRIVYSHVSPPVHHVTVTFADRGGKTELTMRMVFDTAKLRNDVADKFGAVDGLSQTLGRLGDYVMEKQSADAADSFVISRQFDAPRDTVFKAWTERDQLAQWFGPRDVHTVSATLDLRPGGVFHFCMRTPDGSDIWGKWVFREIDPPRRLVWVHSFADAAGNVTRHPMSPDWPLELLSTVMFAEDGDKTTVVLRWTPINATATERNVFREGAASMTQGWGGTFERLEAHLRQ